MYFVYVLQSENEGRLYIGSSAEPHTRFAAHNAGRGGWTRRFRPWKMVFLEEHDDRAIAQKRERYLKSGWGRRWLNKHLESEGWLSGLRRRS